MKINELSSIIIEESIYIHKKLGPGLLESVYESTLYYRLQKRNLSLQKQKGIPVIFENTELELGFRADLIVENKILIEIKSLETVPKVAFNQVLTYLRLLNIPVGLLINFNVVRLVDGIKRIVNNLPE